MKVTLFGSRPSAIQATFTPAPVMPSERAVCVYWSLEAVPVSDGPSGASWGVLLQAPGMLCAGRLAVADLTSRAETSSVPDEVLVDLTGLGAGPLPIVIVASGTTSATMESLLSRSSSPAETVAANESTSA